MGRAFRIESMLETMHKIANFLTVGDYELADKDSTDRIIKKQSRGSVFAQNGWYISKRGLQKQSREADMHMRNLRRALKNAK